MAPDGRGVQRRILIGEIGQSNCLISGQILAPSALLGSMSARCYKLAGSKWEAIARIFKYALSSVPIPVASVTRRIDLVSSIVLFLFRGRR